MNPANESLPYRPCVGIMLLNRENKVFVGKRIDQRSEAWQMPQGGVDPGEALEQTALRELEEEIGTKNATIIAQTTTPLYYDLPDDLIPKLWGGKFRGQEQIWFLMRFEGTDAEINLETKHPEFLAWKWAEPSDLPGMIVPFKRALYEEVLHYFKGYL